MTSNETLVLTGMSGAGRSTVAHALEDLGWYVVDNLPPALLPALVGKGTGSQGKEYAVVVDVRGGHFFDELIAALAELKKNFTREFIMTSQEYETHVINFNGTNEEFYMYCLI